MKTLGILSALFAGLNSVEDVRRAVQIKQNRIILAPSKTRRTKGAYDRSQRIRANRRKNKRCLTK